MVIVIEWGLISNKKLKPHSVSVNFEGWQLVKLSQPDKHLKDS